MKVKKDCFVKIMISEEYGNEMNRVTKNVEPSQSNMLVRNFKMFEEVENAGSKISYRCNNCRNCKTCKEHARADMMSVKEEVEQNVINKSVTVDTDRRITTALLLLMFNPLHKLAPNKDKALRIYNQQVKKDGSHSCQLIFSRSKLIPDSLSQPRAELFAATMNARTGEII